MKTVLITGGSRGIGKAMVELFASRGYRVAFTYKNSDDAACAVSADTGALAVKADSESECEIVAAVEKVTAALGEIDVLINNAAVSSFGILSDISLEEWNRVMNTSVTAAFLYSKAVLSQMIKKKQGRIINISSVWGLVGASCEVHYSTAKAALIGFTKALAKELGPSGITVNAIAPGVINTDMNRAISDEDMSVLADETPIGRIGEPGEVANAALILASDEAGFITGDVLNISGGFVI
jgi:3-oxoacyl-[acyl-carrier protein] reductase